MKEKIQIILKWFFILYIIPTSFYGMYLSFGEFYFFTIHDSTRVNLKNGFVFGSTDKSDRIGNYNGIFYPNGKIAIEMNVIHVEEYGDFVYGYREAEIPLGSRLSDGDFYFICGLYEDCSATQNYSRATFQKILKEKRIPPYEYHYFHHLKMLQVKEWILVHLFLKDEVPRQKVGEE